MDKIITLKVVSDSLHISQIITGFIRLKEIFQSAGYKSEIIDCRKYLSDYPHSHLVEINIDDKVIAFDMLDGYPRDNEKMLQYMNRIDYLFKRSYNSTDNKKLLCSGSGSSNWGGEEDKSELKKIYPLGFNYHVTIKGNPQDSFNFKDCIINGFKLIAGTKPRSYFTEDVICGRPHKMKGSPKILFLSRLWSGYENIEINNMRINIIRQLRERYPQNFIGGQQSSDLVRKLCPDLLMPRFAVFRNKYLKIMQESDICIASTGLDRSIGWKTGEYIAASKAIISEKLYYSVPGDFIEGKNYLAYNSVEECVSSVDMLMNDHAFIQKMSKNNREYYNSYLKPEKLVLNALNKIGYFTQNN